ncbi:MAG: LacI family DNA-binding transcriptional regulator [Phycisphaeraceae bacterium]|nr:MAG: LacI family DNA-binding transcriptional regulator [Phycisphaeraceae bacterium]
MEQSVTFQKRAFSRDLESDMGSVRKIAKRVGVSVATVSRALNNHPHVDEETRRRVLRAADEAGYSLPTPARKLTTVLALVYPDEVVRPDYGGFDSALLSGVLRGLNEHRFDLKIISIRRDKKPDETYAQFFERKGVRGVILRNFQDSRPISREIANEGFPSVVVADRFDDPSVNFICCESRDDTRRAVQHLIDLGHRAIAIGYHAVPDTDHADRLLGYREAHAENDIPENPALMVEIYGSMEGGASLVNRLMSMAQPPTALVLTDPLATVGALRRCLELGIRVPHDLSVVGFDDSDIRRHTFPSYTAVCQDAEMLGFEAARWLTRRLSRPDDQDLASFRVVRQTFLEINRTTGRPPSEPFRVLPDGSRTPVVSPPNPSTR